jgi:hypothetical protein
MNIYSLPYDLRIGVTGHRSLGSQEVVERVVDGVLDHLGATLDDREQTPLRWTVISALARGADRIVARAVLRRADARLVAVLPFPAQEYRRDFAQPDDLAEFEHLLAEASEVVALENPAQEAGRDETTGQEPPAETRNRGYLAAGQWVVDHCEILVAIWDGEPAGGIGGTAQVVQYALEQKKTVLWINAKNSQAPAAQVLGYDPQGTAPPRTVVLPEAAESLSPGFVELTEYNRQGVVKPAELLFASQRETENLARAARETGLDAGSLQPVLDQLLPRYVWADRLALWHQRRSLVAGWGFFYLSAAAVTLAVIQEVFFHGQRGWWIGLLEFIALGTAWFLYAANRRGCYHQKWLRNRYIAERLRAAVFTVLVGEFPFPNSSGTKTPFPFYPSPKNWLLTSLDRIIADALRRVPKGLPFLPLKQFILRNWILDQGDWHHRNAARKSRSAHCLQNAGICLFFVTMILTAFHVLQLSPFAAVTSSPLVDRWIALLVIAAPAWAAACHAVATLLEYERIATRSERMSQALKLIAHQADSAVGPAPLRAAVCEAAQVIGMENHEWWILLSFRELALL